MDRSVSSEVCAVAEVTEGKDNGFDAQQQAKLFLRALYGECASGYMAIGHLRRGTYQTAWFPVTDLDAITDAALSFSRTEETYFGIGLHRVAPESGRGVAENVSIIPGLWIDIDVLGPAHTSKDLPPDRESALGLLRLFPHAPSWIVWSGHGFHAWWLFDEPWVFESDEERQEAHTLVRRLQRWFQEKARERGWHIDTTTDLARVLRLPGTVNRKCEPVMVETIHSDPDRRYNAWAFETLLPDVEEYAVRWEPQKNGKVSLVSLEPVLDGCAWMRHCRDDAKTLPEPEWFAMLSIVGRCQDGARHAHDLSKPYSRYDREETEGKLKNAAAQSGPRTCANIRYDLGFGGCADCPYWGKVKSPIVLAMPKKEDRPPTPGDADAPSARNGALSPESNGHDEVLSSAISEPGKAPPDEDLALGFTAAYRGALAFVEGQQWFFYQPKGVWQVRNTQFVRDLVHEWIAEYRAKVSGKHFSITARKRDAVLNLSETIFRSQPLSLFDTRMDWIALENGVYDLATDKMRDHSPDNWITQVRPYPYDPKAECPRWMQFLDETLVNMDGTPCLGWHSLFQEWAGYLLVPTARCQKCMFWVGGGANGKSVALKVMEHLVGPAYTTALMIGQLDKEYHLGQLRGKMLAVISEIDRRALREKGEMLKRIVDGSTIQGRKPYGEPFDYESYARIMLACNALPRTDDTTEGYLRRPLLMEWRQHIPEEKRDPMLSEKLRTEISGIFNWALVGLRRLQSRNWIFEIPEESRRMTESYRRSEDNVLRFVEEMCVRRDEVKEHTALLYQAYVTFCEGEGEKMRVVTKDEFAKRLARMDLKADRLRRFTGDQRLRGFYGIALRTEYDTE